MLLFAASGGLSWSDLFSGLIGAVVGAVVVMAMTVRREHRNQVKDALISVRRNTTALTDKFQLWVSLVNELAADDVSDERSRVLGEMGRQASDKLSEALLDIDCDHFVVKCLLGHKANKVLKCLRGMGGIATDAINRERYNAVMVVGLQSARNGLNEEVERLWSKVDSRWHERIMSYLKKKWKFRRWR